MVDDGSAEDVRSSLGDHQNTGRDVAVYDSVLDETGVANHITYDAFNRRKRHITSLSMRTQQHIHGHFGRAATFRCPPSGVLCLELPQPVRFEIDRIGEDHVGQSIEQ